MFKLRWEMNIVYRCYQLVKFYLLFFIAFQLFLIIWNNYHKWTNKEGDTQTLLWIVQ